MLLRSDFFPVCYIAPSLWLISERKQVFFFSQSDDLILQGTG